MTSVAIVDSGPLVAAANRRDPDHAACVDALTKAGVHLIVPALCVAEAAYFIGQRHGPDKEARFVRGLEAFEIHVPSGPGWRRVAELVETYRNFPLGAADASVVVAAEAFRTDLLITLDRRHFSTIRPAHCPAFRLLPE